MATLREEIAALLQGLTGDGSRPALMDVARTQGGSPPAAAQAQPDRSRLDISGARPRFGGGRGPATPSQEAFAAGLADPFGLPTAAIGLFNPQMRDRIRGIQAGGEPGVGQLGQFTSGAIGIAGLPGMGLAGNMAAGAASGSAPAIDYVAPTPPPGANLTNAIVGPVAGAAFPAGQALGPVANSMRWAMPAAALGGAGAIGYGMMSAANEAEAQNRGRGTATPSHAPAGNPAPAGNSAAPAPAAPTSGGFDQRTLALINRNADMRALYSQLQEQEPLAQRPASPQITSATRAANIKEVERLRGLLNARIEEIARGQAPFSEAHPVAASILQGAQVLAPFALGIATRRANVRSHNAMVEPWQNAVDNAFAAAPGGAAAPAPTMLQRLRGITPAPPPPNPEAFAVNATRAIGNRDAWQTANNLPAWQTGLAHAGENAMVAGAGGLMAMEASMYPHLYNMQRAEPGSDAHNQAMTSFANARGQNGVNAMLGQWMPGMVGAGGAVTGMHIPVGRRMPTPVGDTDALETLMRPRVPIGPVNPPPPPPPPPPINTRYVGGVRDNFRDHVASAVTALAPGGQLSAATLLRGTNFAASRRQDITTAINQINGQINAGIPPAQIAANIRSGKFGPLMAVGGGAAAVTHHSQSQPRGHDGRFQQDDGS